MPYVCHVWLELQPQQTTQRAVAVGQAAPESTFANEPGNDHRCGGEPAPCLLLPPLPCKAERNFGLFGYSIRSKL